MQKESEHFFLNRTNIKVMDSFSNHVVTYGPFFWKAKWHLIFIIIFPYFFLIYSSTVIHVKQTPKPWSQDKLPT